MKTLRHLVVGLTALCLGLGPAVAASCAPVCTPAAACPMMQAMTRATGASMPCHEAPPREGTRAPLPDCCRVQGSGGTLPLALDSTTAPTSLQLAPVPAPVLASVPSVPPHAWRELVPAPPDTGPPGRLLLLHQTFLL